MAAIPVCKKESPSEVIAALDRDGCAVVHGVIDQSQRDAIARELKPYLDAADPEASLNKVYEAEGGPSDFYPGHTKRITALVAKSETFRGFVTHPLMIAACDALLKPNSRTYQVHATAALVIGPGATEQMLHREEDPFQFFKIPRPNMVIASMWALTDFTERILCRGVIVGRKNGSRGPKKSLRPRCRRDQCCSGWAERFTGPARIAASSGARACFSRTRSDGYARKRTSSSMCRRILRARYRSRCAI
jgi:ectoine hydroxylase-related dioxygenase (phytanoyl-CoA dioxygenase family)